MRTPQTSVDRTLRHLWAFVLAWQFPCTGYAQDAAKDEDPISDADVKRFVESATAEGQQAQFELKASAPIGLLQPDQSVEFKVDLETRGVPVGADIYAMVFLSSGPCLITERISKEIAKSRAKIRSLQVSFGHLNYNEFGTLSRNQQPLIKVGYVSIDSIKLTAAGTLGTGSISMLDGMEQNYPINLTVPFETLSKLAMALLQENDEKAKWDKLNSENEAFPLIVNFLYLATANDAAGEHIRNIPVHVNPPKGVVHYDGITLAPALVRRFANGFAVLQYEDSRTNRLRIAAAAPPEAKAGKCNAPMPAPTQSAPPGLEENGRLKISAQPAQPISIGREAAVDFVIEYENLSPESVLYVLLQPVAGNQVVFEDAGMVQKNSATDVTMRWCIDPRAAAGKLRIRQKPITIDGAAILGRMEAGWLAPAYGGGNGRVAGQITFTPPPFNTYYDRIRATPIALTATQDGRLCTVLNTKTATYIDLRIAGR